ncbi:MAG: alpha/beta hydrolase [Rhodovibrionaceae bacterium]
MAVTTRLVRTAAVAALGLLLCAPALAEEELRDLAYGQHERQKIDVYLPDLPKAAPVIFMVHGGAWAIGSKTSRNVVGAKAEHWLSKGYIFVSAGYRLVPDADPLRQAEDLARALAFAQNSAGSWGGDPERFVLMGHSAGAHLVTLLSADPAYTRRAGARPWLGTVALDSAAYDVVAIMQERHFRLYDRAFGEDPDFWRMASPTLIMEQAPPPMLMVCSSRRTTACAQAEGFAARAGSLGGRAEVLPIDLSHGDINAELGEEAAYTAAVDRFLGSLSLP